MWILIVLIQIGVGTHTIVAEFSDKQACEIAKEKAFRSVCCPHENSATGFCVRKATPK